MLRCPWLRARETRFVEAGPLVSFHVAAARRLLPFDCETPLWGVDLTWFRVLAKNNLTLGIVDALSVDHSLRPQGKEYKRMKEQALMDEFLGTRVHLSMGEAFTVVKSFPWFKPHRSRRPSFAPSVIDSKLGRS